MKMTMILSEADFRVPVLSIADTLQGVGINLAVFPFNITPDIFELVVWFLCTKGTMN